MARFVGALCLWHSIRKLGTSVDDQQVTVGFDSKSTSELINKLIRDTLATGEGTSKDFGFVEATFLHKPTHHMLKLGCYTPEEVSKASVDYKFDFDRELDLNGIDYRLEARTPHRPGQLLLASQNDLICRSNDIRQDVDSFNGPTPKFDSFTVLSCVDSFDNSKERNVSQDVADLVHSTTFTPIVGMPLSLRCDYPIRRHNIRATGCVVKGYTNLVLFGQQQPLYLYLVWVKSSIYLMWTDSPFDLVSAISRYNIESNPPFNETVGHSTIILLDDTVWINFQRIFSRISQRWSRHDKSGNLYTGWIVPMLIKYIEQERATFVQNRPEIQTHVKLMKEGAF